MQVSTLFNDETLIELERATENYNSRFPDAVAFLSRYIADKDVGPVEITEVVADGIWLQSESHNERIKLVSHCEITDAKSLQIAFGEWQKIARNSAGPDVPLHKLERDNNKRANMKTFVTFVKSTRTINSLIKEITFTGGLEEFETKHGDQFLYVMAPKRGFESVITNSFTASQLQKQDLESRPVAAYYTVKAWDEKEQKLTMWFVVHDKKHGVSGWAHAAQAGDKVAIWGPRFLYAPPTTTDRILLVGDETVIPAISVILSELNPKKQVHAYIEVEDSSHELTIEDKDSANITWVHRGGDSYNSNLIAHIKQQQIRTTDYVYGGGESRKIAELSRHLRKVLKLPATHVHLIGYWKAAST